MTKELIDQGKLVEAGWFGLRMIAIPERASKDQLDDMRAAFFAGAHHVFASIVSIMDPGDEPTDADLRRMDQINTELEQFVEQFKLKYGKTLGSA
jgi:hypothetical protein